jgi:hypothetical protein
LRLTVRAAPFPQGELSTLLFAIFLSRGNGIVEEFQEAELDLDSVLAWKAK